MYISNRTRNLGTEDSFSILKEVEDLRSRGKDILNFCIGQPDFDTPSHIKRKAVEAITEGRTGYTPSAGIQELRKAVSDYFSETRNIDVKPDSVVIANGSKPFIGYTILSVTDYGKGHEVLYPNPGYPIYESQTIAHGAVPVPIPLLEKNGYSIDTKYLENKINEKSRLLILNSPHNPTGATLEKEALEHIADIVKKHENLWVFSDEVYSRILYDRKFTSIASVQDMAERTIIVDAVSKTYAMTGWRIGFAANRKLSGHLSRWVNNTDSCAGHPNQYAALAALTGSQVETDEMVNNYRRRRRLMVEGLNAIDGVKCPMPYGAFYVWANVTEACRLVGAKDSEDFRQRLLSNAGVAVLSDIHFGQRNLGEGEHIRLSFAMSYENIEEGLRRIGTYVNDMKTFIPTVF